MPVRRSTPAHSYSVFMQSLKDYGHGDISEFLGTLPSRRGSHGMHIACRVFDRHDQIANRLRRSDEASGQPRKFLINVDETLDALLKQEDTDKNMQITIEDVGPKVRNSPIRVDLYRLLTSIGTLCRNCRVVGIQPR